MEKRKIVENQELRVSDDPPLLSATDWWMSPYSTGAEGKRGKWAEISDAQGWFIPRRWRGQDNEGKKRKGHDQRAFRRRKKDGETKSQIIFINKLWFPRASWDCFLLLSVWKRKDILKTFKWGITFHYFVILYRQRGIFHELEELGLFKQWGFKKYGSILQLYHSWNPLLRVAKLCRKFSY